MGKGRLGKHFVRQWILRHWVPRGTGSRYMWEPQSRKGSLGRLVLLSLNHDLIPVMRFFCCSHSWWDVLLLCVFFLSRRNRNAPYLFSLWSHFDLTMVKAPFKSQARLSLSSMSFPFILRARNNMDCLSWSFTKISSAGMTAVFAFLGKWLHGTAYKQ